MNLTPDVIAQLATTFGPIGALAIVLYLNRPRNQDAKPDPAQEVMAELREIRERLTRVETILEERK